MSDPERLRLRHEMNNSRDDRLDAPEILAMPREMAFVVAEVVLHVDDEESGDLGVNQLRKRVSDN